jgi:hypothetical protein
MPNSIKFSALLAAILGASSAMAATAAVPPLDLIMQPSSWVVVAATASLIGLSLGQGPSGTLKPLKLRRTASVGARSALPA